ncbi:alpha/beta fold hydrolase [Lysobacter korlensis]|uniref:Alpha/beta fold hydrolase n=1 Tax=Lysobacter korlensis TaxID=553636 RepID=A0ABV6S3X0_9GAMM
MTTLLLHGLGNDAFQAMSLLGPVLPADTVAPDVRAHGESTLIGRPEDFELDRLAAELPVPAGPLTIVGISMGAALGLRIAISRPRDVRRLVFVRPAFTDSPLPPNLELFPVLGELLIRHGAREAERQFRGSARYRAVELVSRLGAVGLVSQLRAPLAVERAIRLIEIPRNRAFSSEQELSVLDVPTTVVAAPRDPVHPIEVAQQWADILPDARLVTVPARDDGLPQYAEATRAAVAAALDFPSR